jgi:hypothetical protein
MAERWERIPIFYVDTQGFTAYNANTQRTIVRRVQDLATEAARQFIPDGEVWSTWRRHGAGDGYYFLLIGASPQHALHYALYLNDALVNDNAGTVWYGFCLSFLLSYSACSPTQYTGRAAFSQRGKDSRHYLL